MLYASRLPLFLTLGFAASCTVRGTVEEGQTTGGQQVVVASVDGNTSVALPAPIADSGAPLPNQNSTNFGPNVLIYDPSMSASAIQSSVDQVFTTQQSNQFGNQRYALFFKPGAYDANVQVGFYTTVQGLGRTPDAVNIQGGVYTLAAWASGNATQNFWRGVENLSVNPTTYGGTMFWAVSQATHLRRVHVQGQLTLFDYFYYGQGAVNWSSGGFIADSIVDTKVESGSQQQFLTRNTTLTNWDGDVWNMVFVGDNDSPTGTGPRRNTASSAQPRLCARSPTWL